MRPRASMTIGRDRRTYIPLNKEDLTYPSYDRAGRQEPAEKPGGEALSFTDVHGTLTEEQIRVETARCLSCGASYVDPNKCIGCGLCTTRCKFDAIHLVRDHPECTDMRAGEDKIKGMLPYVLKRAVKIAAYSGSPEAKAMAEKRKAFRQAQKAEKR